MSISTSPVAPTGKDGKPALAARRRAASPRCSRCPSTPIPRRRLPPPLTRRSRWRHRKRWSTSASGAEWSPTTSATSRPCTNAAWSRGVSITAETCPHYLAFTEDDFERIGPALKCAPPIRDEATREALWNEVLGGRVDLIGSDHSPCPAADKQKGEHDIWQAWGGIAGIQATLPVLMTDGVLARGLSFERVAHLTATAPAQLFGLYPRKGAIAVGADADFAIVDPNTRWTFDAHELQT